MKAFIDSTEYRHRFGDAPEGNQRGLVEGANVGRRKRREELKNSKLEVVPLISMPAIQILKTDTHQDLASA